MCRTMAESQSRCVQVEVQGAVQGVGCRPYVYRLATALGLNGWVRNSLWCAKILSVITRPCGFRIRMPCQQLAFKHPAYAPIVKSDMPANEIEPL